MGMRNNNGIVLADTRSGSILHVNVSDDVEIDFDTVTRQFVGGRTFVWSDEKDDWGDEPISAERAQRIAAKRGIRGVAQ